MAVFAALVLAVLVTQTQGSASNASCEIPVIVYYGASEINYQVTINNVTREASLVSGGAIDMDYDPISRRLFYYVSNNFYSVKQDGSDVRNIGALSDVESFTVDGRNNVIYCVRSLTDTFYVLNMTTMASTDTGISANYVDMDDVNNYLVIAKRSDDNIQRYNVETKVLDVIKREGDSPQDVSVDGQNGEVYWVNYVDPMHTVMRTSYSNETINLNISDPGEIKIGQDQHYLYVLIPSNETIYKYQKNTWALMGTIDVPSGTNGIEIAFDQDECCAGTFCDPQSTCVNDFTNFTCSCNTGYTGNGTACEDIDECKLEQCHANASCVNNPGSFTCNCDAGFVDDGANGCADSCQVPYLFFSTSSGTSAYDTEEASSVRTIVDNRASASLSVDNINKRLYLYTAAEKMTSYDLDGSNSTDFDINNVKVFAVDGRNNLIYYYHEFSEKLFVYNITSGEDNEVSGASAVAGVRDLEVDTRNGYLYIAKTSDPTIVRYNPSTQTIMDFMSDGAAQSISIDQFNDVIYWANYVGNSHRVMRTSFEGPTTDLNKTYSHPIKLTSDVFNFYVLDTMNNRIEKFSKESLRNQGNFTHSGSIEDMIIAFDKDECCFGTYCHKNATCTDYLGGFNCSCNDGFTSNGTDCIDVNECRNNPCHQNATCTNTIGSFECECNEGFNGTGVVCEATNCSVVSCGENEECNQVGNIFKCVCKADYREPGCQLVERSCHTRGDPHYSTFDGKLYDFMGTCEYVLAKDIVGDMFEVRQKNEPCASGLHSCTKSLTVIFQSYSIELRRGMILVNGGEVSSPLPVYYQGFNISEANNRYTLITSDYGVTVFWNNVYNARVTIKGRYVNRTVGLCGNFNQMEDDDFWTSYGTIVNDAVEFGNSWKVDLSCANATEVMHPCMANSSRLSIAQANCSILFSPPFNSCASHINATARGYYDNCVYDMCACEDDPDVCYCQALDAYSADCAQYVSIHWRQLDQFAICNSSCASAPCCNGGTCRNVDSSFECSCPAGFMGERCEIEDRCQIPYVFFSTSSGTLYHNKLKSNNTPSMVNDNINNALLSFDGINKRLYLYTDKMYSYKLDGSNKTEFNLPNVEFFAVDGRNQLIYYHHKLQDKIYVYDMESGTDDEVAVLSTGITGVKDMEVDMRNGYLYIAKTSDSTIVRYDPSTGNVINLMTGGAGQSITLDQYNDVIYWVNYDRSSHRVMRTLFTGQTSDLNITYSDSIILTSDVLHLYVLDTKNNRIDKILKESLEVQSNFTYSGEIHDIIVAYDDDECCWGTYCHDNATCTDYLGGFNCTCNEGFENNGTDCIDVNECLEDSPCHQNATCRNLFGSYNCTCNDGFIGDGFNCEATNCSILSCGEREECVQVNDIFKCVCKDDYEEPDCRPIKATCEATGDPHYRTFDGTYYDFMGRCEYVLAKDCVNNTFEIRQVNEPCGNGEPSCTKSLRVILPNLNIELLRGIVLDGNTAITLPATYNGVTVERHGRITWVQGDGIKVEWNNVHNVRVTVFGRYLNRTCGLCGTFNRNPDDDFLAQNGATLDNAVDFGNSWKTDPDCENATDLVHPCITYADRNATAVANCSALRTSLFENCTGISPERYIDDCEYDICGCGGDHAVCFCQAVDAYVIDCAATGVTIDWLSDPRFQQCGTPCASIPCLNGGTCSNDGPSSFSCSCLARFSGARCEIEDRCQIPYLFFSTQSNIQSYNAYNLSEGPSVFVNQTSAALLSFDGANKRLYSYTSAGDFRSYDLDGSNSATKSIADVEFFTVDGENNMIYYHEERGDTIQMYDITNDLNSPVAALSSVTRVKDLDMDMKNSYLYIARADVPPIIRYNPSDESVVQFNYNGSAAAQSISVDEHSNCIYWASYRSNTGEYEVFKTSYQGDTTQLNIVYPEMIKVETDELNLYVLYVSSMRIDIYLKSSLTRTRNITLDVAIQDLVIGYDQDECCAGTFCHSNSTCSNSLGSFNCSCVSGFSGNGTYCEDINECDQLSPCHENATCENTIGSFGCNCSEGFLGDGFDCEATNCSILNCGANENCVQVENIFKCVCKIDYAREGENCVLVQATSEAGGDPHYTTFDGTFYHFTGTGEYVLAKDCVDNTFEVRQLNAPCVNGQGSCTLSLTVIFPHVTIKLLRGIVLDVNDNTITLPQTFGVTRVHSPATRITWVESAGIRIEWNNVYNVRVTVFGRYFNKTCGLAGTFNRIRNDDLRTPQGEIVSNSIDFGNSWRTERFVPNSVNGTNVTNPCEGNPQINATATSNCSALLFSPFNYCTSKVNPMNYIRGCVFDVCACGGDSPVCLCQAIEAYVTACASAVVNIDWLSDSRYQQCNTSCASAPCFNGGSCRNVGDSSFECTCPFGFLGDRCELEDLCQVPILYYANNSAIYSYNTKASDRLPKLLLRSEDTQLVYDRHNREIVTYDATEMFSRLRLNGSTIATLLENVDDVERFTYDGRRNVIYYIHTALETIHMINLTSMENNEVAALAHFSDIKDLDIDISNDKLVIISADNLSLVLYDLGESASVRIITYDRGVGQSLYVFDDGTIYWVIFDQSNNLFIVVCTYVTSGMTRELGIQYNTDICVVVDRSYIYVLDKDNNRIDVYSRITLVKLWELHTTTGVKELIIAFDIDECCSNNTCHMNATCSNTPGSFVCECNEGFEPSGDECININECNRGACDPNADCVDSEGSFTCTCSSGFTGNGFNCTEICEEGILYYSTSSHIVSNSSVMIPVTDSVLGYDRNNRKLLYYNDVNDNLYSSSLSGTDTAVLLSNDKIMYYAYDGKRGVLYYLNRLTSDIHSVNISSGQDQLIQALSSLSDIKDLEVDIKNDLLVIARSSDPPIVLFDIVSFVTQEIDFDGSAQALSVDEHYKVVYWSNFDGSPGTHNLMRTFWETGQTKPLNISYDGDIDLAQDYMHLYVLDKDNDRIDKYHKRTWRKVDVLYTNDGPVNLIVAFDYNECCVGTYCRDFSMCTNKLDSFNCTCNDGYFLNGTICEDINECDMQNECNETAMCINTAGSYDCQCMNGTSGDGYSVGCEDINECMQGICHDNATCNNTYGSYICKCYDGFTGDGINCTDIIECDDVCHDNATCIDIPGSYECNCMAGFTGNGTYCEDIDECRENPCHANASCENNLGSFICRCDEEFTGDGFDCTEFVQCLNGSICHQNASCNNITGTPVCSCNQGLTGDGRACADIIECDNDPPPCHKYAFCNNTFGSFWCMCNYGFTGNETFCEDINECDEIMPCGGNATCTNTKGSYNCTCLEGFSGNGIECTEINECDGNNDCHENANCTNTVGSHNCTCNEGFEGDGTYCIDIDECQSVMPCDGNATCTNTSGSYYCTCFEGFTGNGTECDEINECDGENDCHDYANCTNTVGSYNCTCNEGFEGNGINCIDKNECINGESNCDENAACTNLTGSYRCDCNTGFTGNGTHCYNVNECDVSDPMHDCHGNATCTETFGSYICTCNGGFSGPGTVCEDVDECNSSTTNNCHAQANCTNTEGSYICKCKEGYSGDGMACVDIEECDGGNHTCHGNATCTNTPGSYTCACKDGFSGDGMTVCEDIDECEGNGCPENAVCHDQIGRCVYTCKSGFEPPSCTDINECAIESSCESGRVCRNLYGSHECDCPFGQWPNNAGICEDAFVFQLSFTILEGLNYSSELGDELSKSFLESRMDVETATNEQFMETNLTELYLGSRLISFREGTGTNTATAVSLYVYFSQALTQNDVAHNSIRRQFVTKLVLTTKDGVRKLKLRDEYVLSISITGQPTKAANMIVVVLDLNACDVSPCGRAQRCVDKNGGRRCYCNSPRQMLRNGECINARTFRGTITIINYDFDSVLLNPSTLDWQRLTSLIERLINLYFGRSRLSNRYRGCRVSGYRDGSVIVSFLVSLDEAATNETESSVQSAIQSVLSVNSTGVFLGQYQLRGDRVTAVTIEDYDECNPEQTIHAKDCGKGARCINQPGTYTCKCVTDYEGTWPQCNPVNKDGVKDDDAELVKGLSIFIIVFLAFCFLVTFFITIAICKIVCYGTNYQPEEDEISMGRVSTIVAPSFEERGLMREYYNT